ncbi:hypothetical protein SS05631_c12920 [Sinorhizobium sp. CCBAU 05631]|nr:hypothetical protein SS05631_c12920 [Sinorhizobium sp. CCBAU 05631]
MIYFRLPSCTKGKLCDAKMCIWRRNNRMVWQYIRKDQ